MGFFFTNYKLKLHVTLFTQCHNTGMWIVNTISSIYRWTIFYLIQSFWHERAGNALKILAIITTGFWFNFMRLSLRSDLQSQHRARFHKRFAISPFSFWARTITPKSPPKFESFLVHFFKMSWLGKTS